ncbi:MAG: hypothetical protein NUV61_04520 [Candidatus Azambacteria bacterium]|nr:hypothetical protein [Candidatus Azambacteria bacterium]
MWKKIIILSVAIAIIPLITLAWSIGEPLVSCGLSSQDIVGTSKIEGMCTLCDIFVLGQNITDFLTKAIAPALAVLAFALAGFKILTSGGSPGARQEGIKIIRNTIIGLLIVFGAWIVINELLIFFAGTGGTVAKIGGVPLPWNKIICIEPITTVPTTTTDDASVRKVLTDAGILFYSTGNCTDPTISTCTSVEQLPQNAINGILSLNSSCGCSLTISGGTETGHATHGLGQPRVDFSFNAELTAYIMATATSSTPTALGMKYTFPNGTTYLQEIDHWHASFS